MQLFMASHLKCIAMHFKCDAMVVSQVDDKTRVQLMAIGNAIPDRFANPGISRLSLLNPGINPGIESSQIMAGYSWSYNRQK